MAEDRKWSDVDAKVRGAGIGGAVAILIVFGVDNFVIILEATTAAAITAAMAVFFGWLLPETLPWNRGKDDDEPPPPTPPADDDFEGGHI